MNYIQQYNQIINALCRQYQVKCLYAVGSVLTDGFSDESDVDLMVSFQPDLNLHQYAAHYFNLKFALEDLLNRPVDLLEEKAVRNPYFKQAVTQQRQLIYAS